jgi:hypothetical protein
MAEQTITETQFLREDPRFEDIKLDLLEQASRLTRGKDAAGQDLPYEQTLTGRLPSFQVAGFSPAQQAALQAGMQQGVGSFLPYIEAANVSLGGGYGAAGQGIGALGTAQIAGAGAAGTYDPRSAAAFMNPYQQAVTEQTLAEIRRQADIAGQSQAAQAVRTGAFGGTREGVQRAEMERNTQNLMAQQIAQGYAQNYAQAQQAAMQTDEAARARQLGIGQLFGQIGQTYGGIGSQLGQLGVHQAALGQTAQQMQQGDIGFLYGLGSIATGFATTGVGRATCDRNAEAVLSLPAGGIFVRHLQGRTVVADGNDIGSGPTGKPIPTDCRHGPWCIKHLRRRQGCRRILRGIYG